MSNSLNNDFLAGQFKALSNPHRLSLFKQLMSCCTPGALCSTNDATSYCVGELGERLSIAPSTVSHHLKELNRSGLIRMERQGKTIRCWVEPEVLSKLADFFGSYESQ